MTAAVGRKHTFTETGESKPLPRYDLAREEFALPSVVVDPYVNLMHSPICLSTGSVLQCVCHIRIISTIGEKEGAEEAASQWESTTGQTER